MSLPDGGGYAIPVPMLPGCFSQGATVEEAMEHAIEAIEVHIAGLRKMGESVPEPDASPQELVQLPVTITSAA
ncbi:MAG: type II toxin-antitoxin system HicB family antitoxin [Candidatus Dormibacteraceae bacterium]